jgi:hypothetical protein
MDATSFRRQRERDLIRRGFLCGARFGASGEEAAMP